MDATAYVRRMAAAARAAAGRLAVASAGQRNAALRACAEAIRRARAEVQAANASDLAAARDAGLSEAMIDRLTLSAQRVEAMASGLEAVADREDFLGKALSVYERPDGLRIEKRRVPLGVVGIVYESRPNVTADAAALCLKSGNAAILRGGKEALHTNLAIARCLRAGLDQANLPAEAVHVVETTDRAVVAAMARAEGLIDLIIPRGGEGLIRAVVEAATIPVLKHYAGNCHVYVHAAADLAMAEEIVLNAKCQRPGVCNAMETLLVDAAVAEAFLPAVCKKLADAGVALRGDQRSRRLHADMAEATEEDWRTEYLALTLAVKLVDSLDEAIEHINTFGSNHTDAIVTGDAAAAEDFVARVDSSSVMVNASTRLSDGGEYGLGAEVGISTDKLHARGPMGAEDLTTYKWVVTGSGHLRR